MAIDKAISYWLPNITIILNVLHMCGNIILQNYLGILLTTIPPHSNNAKECPIQLCCY